MSDKDAWEFIEGLGDRFPDMTNDEVLLAYREYTAIPYNVSPDSVVGRLVLYCYEHGVGETEAYALVTFGIESIYKE